MPYEIRGECVYKTDGTLLKCHSTRAQAEAHLTALRINVEAVEKKEYAEPMMVERNEWGIPYAEVGLHGTLRTLFNGKVHEAMTAITDQLTIRGYLSEDENLILTRIKGDVLHTLNVALPGHLACQPIDANALDAIALKEFPSVFLSAKESSTPRWTLITSSAYRDRDGQIVSMKAHAQDIAYMEKTGQYGTLDWWHMHPAVFEYLEQKEHVATLPESIRKNGIILGDCDFSGMYGKLRIESGTYRDPDIAALMQAHAKELSASLLFFRPQNEPDSEGVFNNIHTVSRALMPRGKVSNFAPLMAHLN